MCMSLFLQRGRGWRPQRKQRDWLHPCTKQICNSIKCPSKRRWGVTERGVEREWECQCRLADRQDGGDFDVFIGLSSESTGPLQGANWFHSGLDVWEERKPTGATTLHTSHRPRALCTRCWLIENNYWGHNLHIFFSGQLHYSVCCCDVWRH